MYEPQSPTFGYKSETEKERKKRFRNTREHFGKIPQGGMPGHKKTKKYFFPDIDGEKIGGSTNDIGIEF